MKYKVIISTEIKDLPKDHGLSAAFILANYFKSDVVFLRLSKDKTPDIQVGGTKLEIKSPKGSGKKTIENNFRAARKQSLNISVDLRRMKMHQTKAMSRIKFYLSNPRHLERVVVITKSGKVVEVL